MDREGREGLSLLTRPQKMRRRENEIPMSNFKSRLVIGRISKLIFG